MAAHRLEKCFWRASACAQSPTHPRSLPASPEPGARASAVTAETSASDDYRSYHYDNQSHTRPGIHTTCSIHTRGRPPAPRTRVEIAPPPVLAAPDRETARSATPVQNSAAP